MKIDIAGILFSPKQDNNLVVRTWGTPRDQSGLVNHVDLVNKLGIVDLEAGNKVLLIYQLSVYA